MQLAKFIWRFGVAIGVLIALAACQTTSGKVWVTNMAAKNVVEPPFELLGKVNLRTVVLHSEDIPKNAARAFEVSFKNNGFLTTDPSDTEYFLDIDFLEFKKVEAVEEPDGIYYAKVRYQLSGQDASSSYRDIEVVSTYVPSGFNDAVYVDCSSCTSIGPPDSAQSVAPSISKLEGDNPEVIEGESVIQEELRSKEVNQTVKRVAVFAIMAVLTGGHIPYSSGGYGYYNDTPSKNTDSIRKGRPIRTNIRTAMEILSKQPLN